MEKIIKQEQLYNGKVVKLFKDKVELDSGIQEYREIVKHNGGVCIAIKEGKYYYLIKQFRYAFNDYLFEFPAGKLEQDEDVFDAIHREALEEVGCELKNVKYLDDMIPTCGYSNERIHLFYGEVNAVKDPQRELGEDITVYKYTLEQLFQMVQEGIIKDAKTIILIYKLKNAVEK